MSFDRIAPFYRTTKLILASAYLLFRRATGLKASQLTLPDSLLAQAGFRLARRRVSELGLLHSDLWVSPTDE